jgi:hypothetical protein
MKNLKYNLLVVMCLGIGTLLAQNKVIDIAIESISREAIVFTCTISFAGIVRWFEKKALKKKFEKEQEINRNKFK